MIYNAVVEQGQGQCLGTKNRCKYRLGHDASQIHVLVVVEFGNSRDYVWDESSMAALPLLVQRAEQLRRKMVAVNGDLHLVIVVGAVVRVDDQAAPALILA